MKATRFKHEFRPHIFIPLKDNNGTHPWTPTSSPFALEICP